MLQARNLDWIGGAKAMATIAAIPLSAATIGAIGHGRKELSPELLSGFAKVLDISPGLLSALTGAVLPGYVPARGSPAADVASLIWEMRNLSPDQVQLIYHEVKYAPEENGPRPG